MMGEVQEGAPRGARSGRYDLVISSALGTVCAFLVT